MDKEETTNSNQETTNSNQGATEQSKTSTKAKLNKAFKSVLHTVKIVIISFTLAFVITKYVAVSAVIPSCSMENTLQIGDRLIVDKVSYKFNGIDRGDIIVFVPSFSPNEYYIKRVIGLPGEKVKGKNGKVYVNNKEIKETYTREDMQEDFDEVTVPENSYFVLGDNRNDSYDSRFWENKFVDIKSVVGIARLKYKGGFEIFKKVRYN